MPDLDELKIPKAMRSTAVEIIAITDQVCADRFDAELADLARQTVAKLARKRPSPLVQGTRRVWAAGVVYALAQINFLFDPASELATSADDLTTAFGVAKSTMSGKAKVVRDALGMDYRSLTFQRLDVVAANPLAWMIELDGFVVDARQMPVEIQAEAHRLGLIPWVPDHHVPD